MEGVHDSGRGYLRPPVSLWEPPSCSPLGTRVSQIWLGVQLWDAGPGAVGYAALLGVRV